MTTTQTRKKRPMVGVVGASLDRIASRQQATSTDEQRFKRLEAEIRRLSHANTLQMKTINEMERQLEKQDKWLKEIDVFLCSTKKHLETLYERSGLLVRHIFPKQESFRDEMRRIFKFYDLELF